MKGCGAGREHIVAELNSLLGFSRIGLKLLYWLLGHYTAVNVSIRLSDIIQYRIETVGKERVTTKHTCSVWYV